jgi:hypothetical protein
MTRKAASRDPRRVVIYRGIGPFYFFSAPAMAGNMLPRNGATDEPGIPHEREEQGLGQLYGPKKVPVDVN